MEFGFFQVVSVSTFHGLIQGFKPLRSPVPLGISEVFDMVLSEAVSSSEDLPPFSRSAMDGYAVKASDLFGASDSSPAYLDLVGSIGIGALVDREILPGQCMELVTGSALPPGSDAVIMLEYTSKIADTEIEVRKTVAPGEHVMFQGEDCRQGEVVLSAGTRIRSQEIGLLCALGFLKLMVYPRPVVGIISSGDELVPPDVQPGPGQIRDVNSSTLAASIRSYGGEPRHFGIVTDDLQAICSRIQDALEQCDLVLISGGSSVGMRDLTIQAIEQFDDHQVLAHGVSLSPGKPTILSRIGQKPVLGLPGQVTSVQIVFLVLVVPLLRLLAGETDQRITERWPAVEARLSRNLASKQGREDYVRVSLEPSADALPVARPLIGKSGLLKTMLQADGLIRIPAEEEGVLKNSEVKVLVF